MVVEKLEDLPLELLELITLKICKESDLINILGSYQNHRQKFGNLTLLLDAFNIIRDKEHETSGCCGCSFDITINMRKIMKMMNETMLKKN